MLALIFAVVMNAKKRKSTLEVVKVAKFIAEETLNDSGWK